MTVGVTPSGFVAKNTQDVLADIEAAQLSIIDAELDVSPEQPIGQINGVSADQLAQLWELGGVAYNGMNRDNAEGPQLDNINNLTGTKRNPAKPSYTLQSCAFSATGTYVAGSLVANVSGQPSVQFGNVYDIVVALVSGNYQAIQNNVILASSGSLPLTVPNIKFVCSVNGPTVANAGTLNVITTPVTGWASTSNPADAFIGTNVESDTDYRLRGEQEIAALGSGNPDAVRADVLNVPGVIECFVLENVTPYTDVNGVPPHSFECVVWDGTIPAASDTQIAQAIWNDKPTGIGTSGSINAQATDSFGNLHNVAFSRATQRQLYISATIVMLPNFSFTTALATALKTAIVLSTISKFFVAENGQRSPNPMYLGLGNTVGNKAIVSTILDAGLGIFDVTALTFDFTASPTNTANLVIGPREIAIADTGRILINGI